MAIVRRNIEKVKDKVISQPLRTENFGAVTDFLKSNMLPTALRLLALG
jgi:hypothetical protein